MRLLADPVKTEPMPLYFKVTVGVMLLLVLLMLWVGWELTKPPRGFRRRSKQTHPRVGLVLVARGWQPQPEPLYGPQIVVLDSRPFQLLAQ